MKHLRLTVFTIVILFALGWQTACGQESFTSPDGKLELQFEVKDGVPYYALNHEGNPSFCLRRWVSPSNGAMIWHMLSC